MNVINRMYLKAAQGIQGLVEDRRGDTNFISIVIVVALAVLFSTNANNLVGDLWNKITGNVSGLG